ncbi:hypothetical protein CISIN_1g026440mg [Citrus sinensis]|uniref:Uncharacterized protein n=1 Tax=Citrus sinensis TaxID=2711 RepID=A0A067GTP3_CITSI|nr:hypothetical protein CISIN_1g026440mg [Citrus sinensis]
MDMDIDQTIKDKDLFKAAETGDSSTFKSLSKQQLLKSLSLRNDDDRTLLHVAASCGHPEVVEILLSVDESANVVNAVDEEGWAPIHSAASIGNVTIVEMLLSKGADVNLKNDGGRTALHYAASKGWLKIVELLISRGAKINSKDKACWLHSIAPGS